MWPNPQESVDYLKSRLIFKKNTKFTGEYTFKIRFLHELENKGRFSNLHYFTFKRILVEMWNVKYSYIEMLINTDMLAFRFWLKCISSLFKWTIIKKIKQNVH